MSTPHRDDRPLLVTPDNFVRAESDLYFGRIVGDGGFGRFTHNRELTPMDKQRIVRLNRDTLYSAAVFDLDAAPVTVGLPDPGGRFMSAQIITEDEYVPDVVYGQAQLTLDRETVGTRYAMLGIRTMVNPAEPGDAALVHALQDAVVVDQRATGTFVVPNWDQTSQNVVRGALLDLAATLPDTRGMFGTPETTDPVRHLIGAASAWGGNPERDALYLNVTPPHNDGRTVYRLTVSDVPVDGFWSVTVYDRDGYFTPNAQGSYSLNQYTVTPSADGSTTIQFGGCAASVANCLPITDGWNYMVRLYRPRPSVLSGDWQFPTASPVTATP